MTERTHVAVVGAGAFGGWTALELLRRGARVSLLDAWGPGHSRASSGGESRIIRATYGHAIYVEMVARALGLWRENEERFGRKLYRRSGALWMVGKGSDDAYEREALALVRAAGLEAEKLTVRQCAARFPQISFEDIEWAIFEKDAGYLLARQACQAVVAAFLEAGGEYRRREVAPLRRNGSIAGLRIAGEDALTADAYVFACGPWLGELFPELGDGLIRATRQEVFYFGTPPGDGRFLEEACPVWIENGERVFYGIPGNEFRGFKIADDTRGAAFDPTTSERVPSTEGLDAARAYLETRFPDMKGAPLVEARVCQYENSRDEHFIADQHPENERVWILGGGSGHGFKHGPALGERFAEQVLGRREKDPFFSLERFA